eukprot:jgi/Ulvmu1/1914/UM012_0074.1
MRIRRPRSDLEALLTKIVRSQRCLGCGAILVLPLVWSVLFMHRPAPRPIHRLVGTGQQYEYTEEEMARSRAEALTQYEAVQVERGQIQTVPQAEPLTITQLPPRADAHCSEGVDAALPEAERHAATFKCRQQVARQQAEAACDRLAQNPPSPPFTRSSLKLSMYTDTILPAAGADGAGAARAVPAAVDIAVEATSDIVSNEIMARGYWEPSEVRTVLDGLVRANASAAAPPAILVDVGANLGVFTVAAAALGFPVIAFEAMARNVDAIHQTLCWNPELRERITLFPYALGAAERSCLVVSDNTNVADGHLVCDDAEIAAMAGAQSRAPTHSVRLGDYLAGVPADVVKIDVEGYENHVLAGAGTALDSVQYVLSEVSAVDMPKAAGRPFEEVGQEYLAGWYGRGFTITMCFQQADCFTGTPLTAEEALAAAVNGGIINVLFQKHAPAAHDAPAVGAVPVPSGAVAAPAPAQALPAGDGAQLPLGEAVAGGGWPVDEMLGGAAGGAIEEVGVGLGASLSPGAPTPAEVEMAVEEPPAEHEAAAAPLTGGSCFAEVDRDKPEAEQNAAMFKCRKAAARARAESACDRLPSTLAAQQLVRAQLAVAEIAAGFAASAQPDGEQLPTAISIAAEEGDMERLDAASATGSATVREIQTVLAALRRANTTAEAPPAVLVDIGASLGAHAVTAAALGYDVIAFEADPRRVDAIYQTLCWNPSLHDRITLFPHAAIGADRKCHVASSQAGAADGHVVCGDTVPAAAGAMGAARAAVRSVRLGDYLDGVRVDVLKIDSAGYEPRVLSGAGSVLESVQFVVARVDPIKMPQASGRPLGSVADEFLRGWQDRGFELRLCNGGPGCLDGAAVTAEAVLAATRGMAPVDVVMQPSSRTGGAAPSAV